MDAPHGLTKEFIEKMKDLVEIKRIRLNERKENNATELIQKIALAKKQDEEEKKAREEEKKAQKEAEEKVTSIKEELAYLQWKEVIGEQLDNVSNWKEKGSETYCELSVYCDHWDYGVVRKVLMKSCQERSTDTHEMNCGELFDDPIEPDQVSSYNTLVTATLYIREARKKDKEQV